jgi:hypothetical protein
MKYLVIKAPTLTDESAVNLLDFFNTLMNVFGGHYHYQIERYYRESVVGSMADINAKLTDDPPL